MVNLLFAADLHIGSDRWPVSDERYHEPLNELLEYAGENLISAVFLAGDTLNARNPTVRDLRRAQELVEMLEETTCDVYVLDGNHDTFAMPDTLGATDMLGGTYVPHSVSSIRSDRVGAHIVTLPWPHYRKLQGASYDPSLPIEEQLAIAEREVYRRIEAELEKSTLRPRILTGHAHVYYGETHEDAPEGPRLLAGRDVLLSYKWLAERFDLIALGHIHDSGARGYIGSMQPTDFADTGEKVFWHVRTTPSWSQAHVPQVQRVPYKSALTVRHWQLRAERLSDLPHASVMADLPRVDVGRLTVQLTGEPTLTAAEAQDWLAAHARIPHGVTLLPPQRERRLATLGATAEDVSTVEGAVKVWLASKGLKQDGVLHELEQLQGATG